MILSLGSINADFLVRAGGSPSGAGTVIGRDLLRTSGGKAGNVAVLAVRLGTTALLLGCVGDDDLATQALAGPLAAGVDLSRVRRRPGPTGYASVVVPPDGAKTIVLVPNANDAWEDDADEVRRDVASAPEGSVLVADLEVPTGVVTAALGAACERDFTTVLDPAPPERLQEPMLALASHLTPDHREAAELTGIDTRDPAGATRAADALRGDGPGTVYVKLPSGGCALSSPAGSAVLSAPEVEAVDATGAGDAFAGALAWALHAGETPLDAARFAVAASACAVTAYGSQESYPTMDALASMGARVRVS